MSLHPNKFRRTRILIWGQYLPCLTPISHVSHPPTVIEGRCQQPLLCLLCADFDQGTSTRMTDQAWLPFGAPAQDGHYLRWRLCECAGLLSGETTLPGYQCILFSRLKVCEGVSDLGNSQQEYMDSEDKTPVRAIKKKVAYVKVSEQKWVEDAIVNIKPYMYALLNSVTHFRYTS